MTCWAFLSSAACLLSRTWPFTSDAVCIAVWRRGSYSLCRILSCRTFLSSSVRFDTRYCINIDYTVDATICWRCWSSLGWWLTSWKFLISAACLQACSGPLACATVCTRICSRSSTAICWLLPSGTLVWSAWNFWTCNKKLTYI